MVPELRVHADIGKIRIASCGHLFMSAWDETPSELSVRGIGKAQLEYCAEVGHGVVVVNFLNPRAGVRVSAEVRKIARDVADETAATTLGMVTVIEGEGFFAATVRMVMNGIFLLRPPPYPHTNVMSAEEATPFCVAQMNQAMDDDEVLQGLRTFQLSRREDDDVAGR